MKKLDLWVPYHSLLNMSFIASKLTPRTLLLCILSCELINITYFAIFFYLNGYLPAPFVWDKNNTFMDFYNPLYWVIKDEFYTLYQSVYPPINYYFLKLFTVIINFDPVDPFYLRNNSLELSLFLMILNAIIILIVINIGEWKKIRVIHPLLIWVACIFSTPFLFALERNNLIIYSLPFLVIYLSSKNIWIKAITFGILVNIKPYFSILLIQYLNLYSFDKKTFLILTISSLSIFFISSTAVGLDINNFFKTYLGFGGKHNFSVDGMLALPNNLASIYPIKWILYWRESGLTAKSSYAFWFSLGKALSYIPPLLILIALIARPISKNNKIILIIIFIANFSYTTGGYIYIIYIVLIPYLIKENLIRGTLIPLAFIFCIPIDWIPIPALDYHAKEISSYLGGIELVNIDLWLAIGTIVRPFSNFFLMCYVFYHIVIKGPRKKLIGLYEKGIGITK